jgi:hypothetical protein
MLKKFLAMMMVMVLVAAFGPALKAEDDPGLVLGDPSQIHEPTVVDFGYVKSKELPVKDGERGYFINVLQDCWTTDEFQLFENIELENYVLFPDDVVFVWKHKIFEACNNYVVLVGGTPCQDGKPSLIGSVRWLRQQQFGTIDPGAEYIFYMIVTNMMPGEWDWFVVAECNDTTGAVYPPLVDGDIDDVIGANLGLVTYLPLMYGPEPVEVLDPDPGGYPPGRRPGEEGATRCWCFKVQDPGGN